MDVEQLKTELENSLDVVKYDRRNQHILIRCPYCGDSDIQSEAHLAIRISDPDCIVWHCVRCDAAGLFNKKFLDDLKITNEKSLSLAIDNEKSTRRNTADSGKIYSSKNRVLYYDRIRNMKSAQRKLDYMCDRFKKDFSFEDLLKYRTVFDFRTFIAENNLRLNGISENTFDILHKEAIGFLSMNNSNIIFRNITNTWENRYFNYRISQYNESKKFFSIDKKVDIMAETLNLVLCEGCMDLIGIVEALHKDKIDNPEWLFISCSGRSYLQVLKSLRRKGFFDINLSIYADNDTDLSMYKKIKREDILLAHKKINVYYNRKINPKTKKYEKDFGVSEDKIQPERFII